MIDLLISNDIVDMGIYLVKRPSNKFYQYLNIVYWQSANNWIFPQEQSLGDH